MSRFWNPNLDELSPYVPGEQPLGGGLLKLNTNELPFGPSPAVLAALREAADDSLRLYPDPESSSLRRAVADRAGLQPGQVFVGNGSDEVLAHAFRAFFQPGRVVLFPDITYSFYPVYARLFGLQHQVLPLGEDFTIDLAGYQRDNGGIIFPNPNAPTGIFTPLSEIVALLEANTDTVVVVDEAYIDFGGESAVSLIENYPNLLVVQTLSKSRALAGLRVGLAFGDPGLIEGLTRVKNSFNSYPLDRLAQVGAEAAVRDEEWFLARCSEVADNRDWLAQQLEQLGFRVLPSLANFLFARPRGLSAESVYVALRERNIIVRHFEKPRIDEFLRISIGSREDCEHLLRALREILGKS